MSARNEIREINNTLLSLKKSGNGNSQYADQLREQKLKLKSALKDTKNYHAHLDTDTDNWNIYCGDEHVCPDLPNNVYPFPVINKMIAELNRFHNR